MGDLDQAGMILAALKTVLRERQIDHRRPWPTDREWRAINAAIEATGFKIDEPFSRGGMQEWQSTLEAALRLPAGQ
ncbi:hypothetical protein [Mycolicibacterium llatzerense]|uniref:hypothetical protein n=1 Tax=Mycolicibacterium llatzerense TaxID=280871 RepID=UPI0021B56F97|nr:hypothetical protein [Mycolicibacterium llatzerense]MCT7372677.1 hypothetical protein [Mycolicibacterium llatzerense]